MQLFANELKKSLEMSFLQTPPCCSPPVWRVEALVVHGEELCRLQTQCKVHP